MAPAKVRGKDQLEQTYHPDLPLDSDHLPSFQSPGLPSSAPTLPHQATPTVASLNLSVIQRHYPSITSCQSIAAYAVIYTFSSTAQSWEKSGCEGTLFLVTLAPDHTARERFAVIVLNRRGLDNFVLELRNEDEIQVTDAFVILQGDEEAEEESEGKLVYGVWIFCEEGTSTEGVRQHIAETMVENARRAHAARAEMDQERSYRRDLLQQEQMRPAATGGEGSLRQMLGLGRPDDGSFHPPTQLDSYPYAQSQWHQQGYEAQHAYPFQQQRQPGGWGG